MATLKIKKSVGKKGKNGVDDTKVVQAALNKHKSGGGYGALNVDGDAGKKTLAAIKAFQKKVMGVKADSRVDPGGATIAALGEKPGAVTPPSAPAPGSGSGGGSKSKGKSGGSGGGGGHLAVFEKQADAASKQITVLNADIARRETFSAALKYAEDRIAVTQKRYRAGFKALRDQLKLSKSERTTAEIEAIENAVKEAHQCMEKVAKDAKPIDGAECKAGVVKELASLLKLAKDDKAIESIKNLDRVELQMDVAYGTVMGVNKSMRLGNDINIIALKTSRGVFQLSLDIANKEIKKLKKKP